MWTDGVLVGPSPAAGSLDFNSYETGNWPARSLIISNGQRTNQGKAEGKDSGRVELEFWRSFRVSGALPDKTTPIHSQSMYPAISLHEYRLRHPCSAMVPTITQSGLLHRLLEQQQRKTARLARRRAARRRVAAKTGNAFLTVWRAVMRGPLQWRNAAVPRSVADERLTQTAPRRAAFNP